jgi:hypothetical protein
MINPFSLLIAVHRKGAFAIHKTCDIFHTEHSELLLQPQRTSGKAIELQLDGSDVPNCTNVVGGAEVAEMSTRL